MKFTHLHVHSHYSLLDGLPKIDDLLNYCKELDMDSIAITDHGALYGAIEFYKKAKAAGIKPIIGCEMYVAPEGMQNKRPKIDDKRYHLVLLVKNFIGYQNLVKLVTKAWLEGFYYKPRVDKELLRQYSEGLIGLSACLAGEIARAILSSNITEAEKTALEYQEIFGSDNFYLEIEHHAGLPEQKIVNEAVIKIAKKHNIPLIATNDVHYLRPDDAEAQDILMLVNTGAKIDDPERLTMKSADFSLKSPAEMADWFKDTPEVFVNSQKIAEACDLKIELGKNKLPSFEVPDGQTPDEYLKKLCYQGLNKRYGEKFDNKIIERLEYELSVIQKTGFASYFLIVQDFVNWAKNNKIVVGPGRGSVAGSIVSYLINITDIDPIKYNLVFERFLNPERISMPDIDLDFADTRRDEVIAYVRQKYGEKRVAQIITFGTMAARAAIRDAGRAMGYAYSLCDQVAKTIPFGFTLEKALKGTTELRELYKKDEVIKKLIDTAKKLEGVARHASTHACGVVISKDDLTDLIPLQHPTQGDETIVTQYEMRAIEDLGLLKMDFLGLKNLSIIENTINIVKRTQKKEIDLINIPLGDKEVFRLFSEARTTGVFQFESDGMKRYFKELKPTEFEDIISMVALYRPGPINAIPDFIASKNGIKKITYLHSSLEPILKSTYGVMVTQDQVLQIAREFAGFTYSEADILRKAVGKKIKKLLDEQREKFIKGAIQTQKISEALATQAWNFIEPFAQYGFNRAHATCYAMIGYQTAYLKAHFPTEFMAALLTSEQKDIERISFLISECQNMKIKILPPDINHSLAAFTVTNPSEIRFGLAAIKNVGDNIVAAIIEERKANGQFNSISNFIERVQHKDLNKKSLEALIKSGATDSIGERNELLHNLETILNYAREAQKNQKSGQASLFDNFGSQNGTSTAIPLAAPQIKLAKAEPAGVRERLTWEKELLGLYVSEHPMKQYQTALAKIAVPCAKLADYPNGRRVNVGGVIGKIKKIITKNGKPMLFAQLEDVTGKIEVLVFPNTLEATASLWQENKTVIINGQTTDKDGIVKIICNEVKEIR